MTREEIEKLGLTIRKRLGKKANILWRDAERDLFAANIIKSHITKVSKIDEPEYDITNIDKNNYKLNIQMYVSYVGKRTNEEDKAFIMKWLKESIDKESLKRWLEEE